MGGLAVSTAGDPFWLVARACTSLR